MSTVKMADAFEDHVTHALRRVLLGREGAVTPQLVSQRGKQRGKAL